MYWDTQLMASSSPLKTDTMSLPKTSDRFAVFQIIIKKKIANNIKKKKQSTHQRRIVPQLISHISSHQWCCSRCLTKCYGPSRDIWKGDSVIIDVVLRRYGVDCGSVWCLRRVGWRCERCTRDSECTWYSLWICLGWSSSSWVWNSIKKLKNKYQSLPYKSPLRG